MKHYFLNIKLGKNLVKDELGSELPNLEAARGRALQSARELLVEAIRSGQDGNAEAVLVMDDQGQTLDCVHLTDLIPKNLQEHLRWQIFR
jgi:hypothetical protein